MREVLRTVRHGLGGSPGRLVLAVVAFLLVAAEVMWVGPVRRAGAPELHPELLWPVLAGMFAVAELCVLHIQIRREAQTVSLSEIPLVLGLFWTTGHGMVLARIVGPLLVFVLYRRSSPLKTLFNTALMALEGGTAVTVFRAVLGHQDPAGLHGWLAAYAACAAAGVIVAVTTTVVIAVYDGSLARWELFTSAASGAPVAVAVCTVGLVALTALERDPRVAWLLLLCAALLLVAFRAYAALSERHLSLERLYRFSQVVTSSPEVDEVLLSVLGEARELLRAERADVTFLAAGAAGALQVALTGGESLEKVHLDGGPAGDVIRDRVIASASPALLPRSTRDPEHRRFLEGAGLREAIVAPLRGEAGIIGTVSVADRMGEVRAFDRSDVKLLETVANHASVALQNSRLIDQLRHEALHDGLTGLPNRTMVQRRITETLEAVAAGRSCGLGVMILDLDGFKQVNDTFGHAQGDLLLREVAQRLRSAAGPGAMVARLGGDEFAVVAVDTPSVETASRIGRRLLHALEEPVVIEGTEVAIGGSIGLSLSPEHGSEVSQLLRRADVAMYEAKSSAAGLRVYEAAMDTTSPTRLALVGELRTAIATGQLVLHVQPQVELVSSRVTGVEVLVRWEHPERGLVLPDEFVPIAERSGLIRTLTSTVLSGALESCSRWLAAGVELGVAVNLSARSLLDVDLAEQVRNLLEMYAVPARLLTLEITESSVMTDAVRALDVLHRLNALGVRLSVDDFGTGYSSLSYLKRLPVQEVKIDKSFVTGLTEDADDATIVASIVNLGRSLSLQVVAEGVESAACLDRLTAMGCDCVQGFLVARPMPVGQLLPWLNRYESIHPVAEPVTAGAAALG